MGARARCASISSARALFNLLLNLLVPLRETSSTKVCPVTSASLPALTTIAVVRVFTPSRLRILLLAGILLLALPPRVCAQDPGDTPLGDVARSFRKKPAAPEALINVDNDNLSKVMDAAAARHAASASPVFTLDPGGKSFRVSSPDVSCSLSFTAKTSSLLTDPLLLDDLPREELAKLDGPATLDGDSLQVSMHNGTAWQLREVVIGLTIVKQPEPRDAASNFGQARIVHAVVAGAAPQQVQDSYQKQPDVTLLLHVKGSAAPSTTATFRTSLNFALFPDQDWHWAIVRAKGIPPQAPPDMTTSLQPEQSATQLPPALAGAVPQMLPPIPPSPNQTSGPDGETH